MAKSSDFIRVMLPEHCHAPPGFVHGKQYRGERDEEFPSHFWVRNDNGDLRMICPKGCNHLGGKAWNVIDKAEDIPWKTTITSR